TPKGLTRYSHRKSTGRKAPCFAATELTGTTNNTTKTDTNHLRIYAPWVMTQINVEKICALSAVISAFFNFIPHGQNIFKLGARMNFRGGADPQVSSRTSIGDGLPYRRADFPLGSKGKQLRDVNSPHQNPLWVGFVNVTGVHGGERLQRINSIDPGPLEVVQNCPQVA